MGTSPHLNKDTYHQVEEEAEEEEEEGMCPLPNSLLLYSRYRRSSSLVPSSRSR